MFGVVVGFGFDDIWKKRQQQGIGAVVACDWTTLFVAEECDFTKKPKRNAHVCFPLSKRSRTVRLLDFVLMQPTLSVCLPVTPTGVLP